MLSKVHPVTDLQPLVKTHAVKQLTPSKEVIVAHYDARQFNYVQYSDRGETLDLAEDPAIELFNEYYGGGMNAIVFQEMRFLPGLHCLAERQTQKGLRRLR